MSETIASPNNRSIVYRGKAQRENTMPVKSKAQSRFMHAAAEGRVPGVSPKVGAEFVSGQEPGATKDLPERVAPQDRKVSRLQKSGLISETQGAKLRGRYGGKDQEEIPAASR